MAMLDNNNGLFLNPAAIGSISYPALPLFSSIACNAAAMLKSVLLHIQIDLNMQQHGRM
jgi:hypothetical protein